MAIPGIVGTAKGGIAAAGDFEVTPPGGATGNIAFVQWYGTSTELTAPTGWTEYLRGNSDPNSPTDPYTNFAIFTAGSSPGTTWNHASSGAGAAVVILGINAAIDIHAAAGTNVNVEGGNAVVDTPSVTLGESALVIGAVMSNLYGAGPTWTYPTNRTLGRDQQIQLGGGEYWTVAIAAEEIVATGATAVAGFQQNNDQWYPRAQTIALIAPEGGGGTTHEADAALSVTATTTATIVRDVEITAALSVTATIEVAPQGAVAIDASLGVTATSTVTAQVDRDITAAVNTTATITAAAELAAQFTFGKAISTNRRYLVDQNGDPWLKRMTSPWGWVAHYDLTSWQEYFAIIAGQGFNACLFEVIATADGGGGVNNDGRNYNNDLPFVGGDITNLNTVYWDHIVDIVDAANAEGITPVLSVIDGWALDPIFTGRSEADCFSYGQQVGTLMNGKHVLWHIGGDYEPVTNEPWDGAATDLRMREVMRGVRDVGHNEPFTVQLNYDYSFPQQNQFWERELGGDLGDGWSFGYSYYATYAVVYEAYHWTTQANQWAGDRNPRPIIHEEGNYNAEDVGGGGLGVPTTHETIRRQAGWAMTHGSPGFGYGDGNWDGSETSHTAYLDTPPPVQVNQLADVVVAQSGWQDLIPDINLVTAGAGTRRVGAFTEDVLENDYVSASRTANGALALVYIPSDATNSARQITLDYDLLGEDVVATWYDPVTYGTSSAGAGPSFTVPAAHSDGTRDYLLILSSTPQDTTVSLTTTAAITAEMTVVKALEATLEITATSVAGVARSVDASTELAVTGTWTSVASVGHPLGTVLPVAASLVSEASISHQLEAALAVTAGWTVEAEDIGAVTMSASLVITSSVETTISRETDMSAELGIVALLSVGATGAINDIHAKVYGPFKSLDEAVEGTTGLTILHARSREYLIFRLEDMPLNPTSVQISFDPYETWHDLQVSAEGGVDYGYLLVAGPSADAGDAVVLPLGRSKPLVRIIDAVEIVVWRTGVVIVRA